MITKWKRNFSQFLRVLLVSLTLAFPAATTADVAYLGADCISTSVHGFQPTRYDYSRIEGKDDGDGDPSVVICPLHTAFGTPAPSSIIVRAKHRGIDPRYPLSCYYIDWDFETGTAYYGAGQLSTGSTSMRTFSLTTPSQANAEGARYLHCYLRDDDELQGFKVYY